MQHHNIYKLLKTRRKIVDKRKLTKEEVIEVNEIDKIINTSMIKAEQSIENPYDNL